MLKSLRVVAPIVGATGVLIALSVSAHADVDLVASDDPLLGSTNAIFLGGTAEPTPSTAYVEAADKLYLEPLGFAGGASICDMAGNLPCDGSLQVLTTPEVFEFGPSSLQDETNLVYAIEAEYNAGEMSPTDPLTVFAYSQSAIAASAAEKMLCARRHPPGRPAFRVHRRPERRERHSHQHLFRPDSVVRRRYNRHDSHERRSHRHQRRPIRPRRLACRLHTGQPVPDDRLHDRHRRGRRLARGLERRPRR